MASLDALSNGRVILGIGAGWNAEEMEDHGVPFKKRWRVTGERIKAIRRIWTEDAAEFHGELVNCDLIWRWPNPVQGDGPPVWMGSLSTKSFECVRLLDGWLPIEAPIEALQSRPRTLCESTSPIGRKFETIELAIALFAPNEDKCKRLIELGFTHLVLAQPSEPRDKVLKRLDEAASIAAKI